MKKKKQATFPKCYFKIFALLKRGKQMDRHDIGAKWMEIRFAARIGILKPLAPEEGRRY